MKREEIIRIVEDKYNLRNCRSYKVDAYRFVPGGEDCTYQLLQGYVVGSYFIDEKTLQIFDKSYFNMINNVEDDENL